jgi:hypothetical protein
LVEKRKSLGQADDCFFGGQDQGILVQGRVAGGIKILVGVVQHYGKESRVQRVVVADFVPRSVNGYRIALLGDAIGIPVQGIIPGAGITKAVSDPMLRFRQSGSDQGKSHEQHKDQTTGNREKPFLGFFHNFSFKFRPWAWFEELINIIGLRRSQWKIIDFYAIRIPISVQGVR